MKTWLTKLRISFALDSGKPLPESLQRAIEDNPELRDFARHAKTLENSAAIATPKSEPMHDSIMRAVRQSASASARAGRQARRPAALVPWLAAGISCAAIATLFLAYQWRQDQLAKQARTLENAMAVLDRSRQASTNVPTILISPLSNELALVDRDIQNAKKVLLATLP